MELQRARAPREEKMKDGSDRSFQCMRIHAMKHPNPSNQAQHFLPFFSLIRLFVTLCTLPRPDFDSLSLAVSFH